MLTRRIWNLLFDSQQDPMINLIVQQWKPCSSAYLGDFRCIYFSKLDLKNTFSMRTSIENLFKIYMLYDVMLFFKSISLN